MTILHDSDIDNTKWGDFVKNHPLGNIFQTPEMYRVYQKDPRNHPIAIAILNNDNDILGVFLALIIYDGIITKLFTARSIIIGGPLVSHNDDNIIKQLLDEYKRIIPKFVIYSEIRPVYCMQDIERALIDNNFTRIGHYNLFLDITQDKTFLWNNLHKERRRNIKKATESGLSFRLVEKEEDISRIVDLIRGTYKRKNVPLTNSEVFTNAHTILGDCIRFFAVYYEGKMIAGQIRLCYSSLVYAWYAGCDANYFKLYPNDFLMWNVICWAHDSGYGVFDFGGGGEPGVQYGVRDYKLKFGCEISDYGRYQSIHRSIAYALGALAIKHISKR